MNITKNTVLTAMMKRQASVMKIWRANRLKSFSFDAFDDALKAIKENTDTDFELQKYFNI